MKPKKIIITGGATRIGAAIAESLAGYDTGISIHYNKSKSAASKLKNKLEKLGSKIYLLKADLNNFNQTQSLLKVAYKKMKEAAEDLEFEEAAKIRDEIRKLEASELEITLNPKISQYNLKSKIYPKGRSTLGMPGTKVNKKRKK